MSSPMLPLQSNLDTDSIPLLTTSAEPETVQSPDTQYKFIVPTLLLLATALVTATTIVSRPSSWTRTSIPPQANDVVAPTVLISLDGFSYEYLYRKKPAAPGREAQYLAPTLNKLAREGVLAEHGMQPVMPTKTFPNHWTIATGLYPENHGIVGNTMYDPLTQKWFHLSDTSPEWWHGSPIWQTISSTPRKVRLQNGTILQLDVNYTSAAVYWPGSSVEKHRPDAFWNYEDGTPHDEIVSRAVSLLKGRARDLGRPAQFVVMYFSAVDTAGHQHGPYTPEVDEQIESVDRAVASLLEQLGPDHAEKYNVIVVSDHGMTATSRDRTIDLGSVLKQGTVQDVVISPMGLFLNISAPAEKIFTQLEAGLKQVSNRIQVFRKEHIPERWFLRNSRLITEVVTMTKLGWSATYPHQQLVPDPRGGGYPWIPKGNHGFDNIEKEMQAIFVAQGPAFRNKSTVTGLTVLDVYEMICFVFDADPAPNNGSLHVTKSSILL